MTLCARLPSNAELEGLIKRSLAAYEALPVPAKRAIREAQRRSWVIGEMMIHHPEMTRGHAEAIYDQAAP